ncbi:hypothetical protein JUN65_08335 [Gluconacetobacter azotocaptans]|uniref:hypothetical protein n=1 Tax=Gluconacetobacter azotocaptans TaxID=142834 RepID=UPI00195A649F|nr:hypothetical protein [Gluconacetobacter azotocaptans]MBM9401593.1 hypothetical protein [Gluconacetobacter azotocaptans]
MSDTIEKTEVIKSDPAMITLEKIRGWYACGGGRDWFREKFPQGGSYGEVMNALYADNRHGDARWLANKAFDVTSITADFIQSDVQSIISVTNAEVEIEGADRNCSDDDARAGFSGDDAQAGFSGYGARAGFSGDDARAGFSGDDARAGFSGNYARAGFSGDDARIDCTGKNCTFAIAGKNAAVKLGPGGAASIAWHDGKRDRFVTIYEGEDGILPDVFYRVENGKIVTY